MGPGRAPAGRKVLPACRAAISGCCSIGPEPAAPGKPSVPSRRRRGGWNRIQIEVEDIEATVKKLKDTGGRFRGEIVTGNGGKQILVEDPSGNPIELFQAI